MLCENMVLKIQKKRGQMPPLSKIYDLLFKLPASSCRRNTKRQKPQSGYLGISAY
jgi:hypothetical protein